MTTLPAAITQPSPIVTPASTVTRAPSQQSSPMTIGLHVVPCSRIGRDS
ncbi:hypothetical protein [Paraburkholderia caribensis]